MDYHPIRTDWGSFPKLIRHCEFGALRKEPEYVQAKSGSDVSALILCDRMLNSNVLDDAFHKFESMRPRLVPVLDSDSKPGVIGDRIPLSMACLISDKTGWEIEFDIIKTDGRSRVGMPPIQRVSFNSVFEGEVERGRSYLIIDDSVVFGGTIASLKGHIESRGGIVCGAMVMSCHEDSLELPIKEDIRKQLVVRHGCALDDFLLQALGYGIDRLTNGEALYLSCASNFEAIRDRILKEHEVKLL